MPTVLTKTSCHCNTLRYEPLSINYTQLCSGLQLHLNHFSSVIQLSVFLAISCERSRPGGSFYRRGSVFAWVFPQDSEIPPTGIPNASTFFGTFTANYTITHRSKDWRGYKPRQRYILGNVRIPLRLKPPYLRAFVNLLNYLSRGSVCIVSISTVSGSVNVASWLADVKPVTTIFILREVVVSFPLIKLS